ncbi:MAG: NADP-dependent oxidoreductase [Bacteroidales bacterium]|jgi:NADPH:quinone reductase-like Zn-dependent oxidoreductase
MKALVVTQYGGFENLKLTEVEKPVAGEGELLVKIKAASVNPVDWKLLSGGRGGTFPVVFPYIIGWDMSGTIEERGHAARRFEIGDNVYGYIRRPELKTGTYAEYISVSEAYLSKAPEKIVLKDASAVPLAGLTAYQGLTTSGHLKRGEVIMILGASGGVGTFAIQIAKNIGAKVIAVSSPANFGYLMDMGADACLDYTDSTWVSKAACTPPDFIFDCVGGEILNRGVKALKKGGRIISTTLKNFPDETLHFSGMFVEPHSRNLDLLTDWIDHGKLKPYVSKYFTLENAIEALKLNKEGRTRGKIVINMND